MNETPEHDEDVVADATPANGADVAEHADAEIVDDADGTVDLEADAAPDPLKIPDPRDLRIALLERKAAEAEERLREYIRAHKKAQLDTDAFKQRLLRDQAREVLDAKAKAVRALLPVADNLQRSLDAAARGGTIETFRTGVQLVARQFGQALEGLGLERVDPTGQPFDPAQMEALGIVPVTDPSQDGRVVACLQVGYRIGELELRPASVQVGQANS